MRLELPGLRRAQPAQDPQMSEVPGGMPGLQSRPQRRPSTIRKQSTKLDVPQGKWARSLP